MTAARRNVLIGAACLFLALSASSVRALPNENPRGLWLTSRKDASNQARADVSGRMTGSPREVWRISTGGDVGSVRPVNVGGRDAALIQVGTGLQLTRWTGDTVWRDISTGVGQVLHVGDFDGDGRQEALITKDVRTVALLDLATGTKLWSWQADPSTQISSCAFYKVPGGIRFICFPAYSLNGYCFDFTGSRTNPKLLWQKSYAGKYGEGYGPSIVLKDMDGDGKVDIALSGKIPSVYQAAIDIDTGEIKFDVYYDVDGWGRPYGLFKAVDLDGDGKPEFVMVCCQVEEYIAVARNVDGKGLRKIWSKFIEKDWPEDHKELRPQITSLADLQGNGKIELVVGLWEDNTWRTLVIAPLRGFTAQRGDLKGYYFWGCHDLTGDGIPEIIVSREKTRRTARVTTLTALDGRTLKPVAELSDAAVFVSTDSPMPEDSYFMALRRNPVYLKRADGTGGILVRRFRDGREIGTFLWGGKSGVPVGPRSVADAGFARADVYESRLCLTDAAGRIQRFDANLRPVGKKLATQGRISRPLVWSVGGKRELVFDTAGGRIRGGVPNLNTGRLDGGWEIEGTMPALHIDSAGVSRLAVADISDPDNYAVSVYERSRGPMKKPLRIAMEYPPYIGLTPYGRDFHLLVNLQTGVHTMALACYDAGGRLLWQDTHQGAHPRVPGAGDVNGDGQDEAIADDHGVLKIYNSSGAVLGTDNGWPPAYTLPIIGAFGKTGEALVLRASGIDALSLIDAAAKERWKTLCERWRYYRSLGGVGDVSGDGALSLGTLGEGGMFDCIDAASGKLRWSLRIADPNETSVVSGDVDGNGKDEFLLGLGDGRLVCIADQNGAGTILWEKRFEAGVANPIIADIDGDGTAEIIVSTSDGCVRILEE